jgi:hypothetical protein
MLLELILLLNLILGIVFGFIHRGKEDYTGLLLGIIFVLAARYLSIDFGFTGILGILIEIIIFLIIFILGAFIGDKIEGIRKK